MVMIDLNDVLRDILGSLRVQYLRLPRGCSSPEASMLDFQFRGQLYGDYDYAAMAASLMALAPARNVIDYNLKTGLLLREVEWESPKGERFALKFERIVSLKRLHTIALRLRHRRAHDQRRLPALHRGADALL